MVYAIGLLAVLHYWWHKAGKNDLEQPMIYAAVLAVLLAGGWPPGGGVVPERGRLPAAARSAAAAELAQGIAIMIAAVSASGWPS